MGTFDGDEYYVKDVLIVSHTSRSTELLKKMAGVLNSTLMRFFYNTSFPTLHVQRNELASLPIKQELLNNGCCESIPRLVDGILAAKGENSATDTNALERKIDQQVYALYGLTPEEIKVVEDAPQ